MFPIGDDNTDRTITPIVNYAFIGINILVFVLLQGLDDFIVVDTKDALLICRKDKEQEIKEFVAEVKRNKGDKYL